MGLIKFALFQIMCPHRRGYAVELYFLERSPSQHLERSCVASSEIHLNRCYSSSIQIGVQTETDRQRERWNIYFEYSNLTTIIRKMEKLMICGYSVICKEILKENCLSQLSASIKWWLQSPLKFQLQILGKKMFKLKRAFENIPYILLRIDPNLIQRWFQTVIIDSTSLLLICDS